MWTLRRVDLKNRTEKRSRHIWMNCRVIRDREAPGSNPGPPTNLYSKFAISESLWSQLHSAVSQFPTEQANRGGVNSVVIGQREIAGQRPVATQRSKPADTQGGTVRHPFRNPQS